MALTHYEVLRLQNDDSQKTISDRYRDLGRIWHPDKAKHWASPTKLADCEEIFKRIQEAYEVLRDPVKKAQYDNTMYLSSPNADDPKDKEFIKKRKELEKDYEDVQTLKSNPVAYVAYLQRRLREERDQTAQRFDVLSQEFQTLASSISSQGEEKHKSKDLEKELASAKKLLETLNSKNADLKSSLFEAHQQSQHHQAEVTSLRVAFLRVALELEKKKVSKTEEIDYLKIMFDLEKVKMQSTIEEYKAIEEDMAQRHKSEIAALKAALEQEKEKVRKLTRAQSTNAPTVSGSEVKESSQPSISNRFFTASPESGSQAVPQRINTHPKFKPEGLTKIFRIVDDYVSEKNVFSSVGLYFADKDDFENFINKYFAFTKNHSDVNFTFHRVSSLAPDAVKEQTWRFEFMNCAARFDDDDVMRGMLQLAMMNQKIDINGVPQEFVRSWSFAKTEVPEKLRSLVSPEGMDIIYMKGKSPDSHFDHVELAFSKHSSVVPFIDAFISYQDKLAKYGLSDFLFQLSSANGCRVDDSHQYIRVNLEGCYVESPIKSKKQHEQLTSALARFFTMDNIGVRFVDIDALEDMKQANHASNLKNKGL